MDAIIKTGGYPYLCGGRTLKHCNSADIVAWLCYCHHRHFSLLLLLLLFMVVCLFAYLSCLLFLLVCLLFD